jgi:hypothetical protein
MGGYNRLLGDAMSQVAAYYIDGDGRWDYSPKKIQALLGKSRDGRKEWTQGIVDLTIEYIDAMSEAKEAEEQRKAADINYAEFEHFVKQSGVSVPLTSKYEIIAVTNQYNVRSIRYRDTESGRFVKKVIPEQVSQFEFDPKQLEKKE